MLEYSKEEMHEASLHAHEASRDRGHLEYRFYPFDIRMFTETTISNGNGILRIITELHNQAGYHVHAYEKVLGGFDLWVSRKYTTNQWGDASPDYKYKQTDVPPFYGDL